MLSEKSIQFPLKSIAVPVVPQELGLAPFRTVTNDAPVPVSASRGAAFLLAICIVWALAGCEASFKPERIEIFSLDAWLAPESKDWHGQPTIASGITYVRNPAHFVLLADGIRRSGHGYQVALSARTAFDAAAQETTTFLSLPQFVDLEDLTVTEDGSVWFCDENEQLLLQYSYPALTYKQQVPLDSLLSGISALVQSGRGLEGLSSNEKGELILSFQSPLRSSSNRGEVESVVLLRFAPHTRELAGFLYPAVTEATDVKVGAVASLGGNAVAVLEHGELENGRPYARIYRVSLAAAEPFTTETAENIPLSVADFSDDFILLEKELLLDLRAEGIDFSKPEGLAYVASEHAFYITEDADEAERSDVVQVILERTLLHRALLFYRRYFP